MSSESEIQIENCVCRQAECNAMHFDTHFLGLDTTNNRNGEVYLYTCKACNTNWIHYFIENDYRASGRWFRGLLNNTNASSITPSTAIHYLESLNHYFYGGSFFKTNGTIGSGFVRLD